MRRSQMLALLGQNEERKAAKLDKKRDAVLKRAESLKDAYEDECKEAVRAEEARMCVGLFSRGSRGGRAPCALALATRSDAGLTPTYPCRKKRLEDFQQKDARIAAETRKCERELIGLLHTATVRPSLSSSLSHELIPPLSRSRSSSRGRASRARRTRRPRRSSALLSPSLASRQVRPVFLPSSPTLQTNP